MLIKSISMKNFQCYAGDHSANRFQFGSGINIIIGDNGAGKSKLYDAFYWLLYDKIFSSDKREFISTQSYREGLISDKAKKECDIGGEVECEVIMRAYGTGGREYTIIRKFIARRQGEFSWSPDKKGSELLITKKAGVGSKLTLVSQSDHQSVINAIIPSHLEPYMRFQGEQVDGLMDFTDRDSLTRVINLLSDINVYDLLINVSERGKKSSEKKYIDKAKNLSKNKGESDRISSTIRTLEERLDQEKNNLATYEMNKNQANHELEEIVNKVDDAKQRDELKKEGVRIESQNENLVNKLEKSRNNFSKKMFSQYWILQHAEPHAKKYYNKYDEYTVKHMGLINSNKPQQQKLPVNVPQPVYVQKMLDEERCYVCNSEAKKGSDCYEYMASLLVRSEEESLFVNDSQKYFSDLYDNCKSYEKTIGLIGGNIAEAFGSIRDDETTIKTNERRINEITDEIGSLLDNTDGNVINAFQKHTKNKDDYVEKINISKQQMRDGEQKLEEQKKALNKFVVGDIDPAVLQAKDIFTKLLDISKSTRIKVYDELITSLEASANRIFQSMAEKNTVITGRVALRRMSDGCYMPEIVDHDGHLIQGSNDSNIILVKLALIMAIITSTENWANNYCMISDSPTSKMAENYASGFYSELGKNYKQSIVMTKDFQSIESRAELGEFKIGKIYKLKSTFPSSNKEDRSDLSISIKEIN